MKNADFNVYAYEIEHAKYKTFVSPRIHGPYSSDSALFEIYPFNRLCKQFLKEDSGYCTKEWAIPGKWVYKCQG